VPSYPRCNEARVDICLLHVLVGRFDPLEAGYELGRPPFDQAMRSVARQARRLLDICFGLHLLVVLAELRFHRVQLIDELESRLPHPEPQPHCSQDGQREPRDLALLAHVGHDQVPTSVHRQVGKADSQIPPFLLQPLLAGVEDLGSFTLGARKGVYDDRDVPGDTVVDVSTEDLGQLEGDLFGDLLGNVGRGD
jgi:hypothetical protein